MRVAVHQKQEGWGAGVITRLAVDVENELPEEKGILGAEYRQTIWLRSCVPFRSFRFAA